VDVHARGSGRVPALLLRPGNDPRDVRDYRAAASYDFQLDEADRNAGNRIKCPVLALWGAKGNLPGWYDVLEVWRGWDDDVRGQALDCGHYLSEEAPEATLDVLRPFLRGEI
jgi:haloacetate dehalogenase